MLSKIKEDVTNFNMTTIYYSENENASEDLTDVANGWVTEPQNIKDVKSYMIVVKGTLAAGSILKYTYDFEIPANLDYDTSIFGSFGAFYDDNKENTIINKTSIADKVGLKTEVGIPITIDLQSDVAGKISEGKFINYTIKVTNNSEETLENIGLENAIPEGTTLVEESYDKFNGDNGYIAVEKSKLEWTIEKLKQGEEFTVEYTVKVNGNMAEKNIDNIVYGYMDELKQKSNIDTIKVFKSFFDIEVSKNIDTALDIGNDVFYKVSVTNITDNIEKNVKLKYAVPTELKFNSISQQEGGEELAISTNSQTNEVIYTISELKPNEKKIFYISQTAIKASKVGITSKIWFELENGVKESSSELNYKINSVNLKVSQDTDLLTNETCVGDEIQLTLTISNVGKVDAEDIKVINELSEYIEIESYSLDISGGFLSNAWEQEKFEDDITLFAGEEVKYTLFGKVKENTEGKIISNRWKVSQKNIDDLQTDEMLIKINKSQETNEESQDENAGIYSISGVAWVDDNENGIKDEENQNGVEAQVQLLKDGEIIDEQTTSSDGTYKFNQLEEGDYTVVTNYVPTDYSVTVYDTDIQNSENSNFYEANKGTAVTDTVRITNCNIENLNAGFVEKEKFDFKIDQTIVKAEVQENGKVKEYFYNNEDITKLKLLSKDAILKIQYRLRVENVGNIDGKVLSIVDYVPNGMKFVESDNAFWAAGVDGNIYYSGLKDTTIKAGDYQDVTLVLQLDVQNDKSIILSNKAQIAYTEGNIKMVEAKENNLASYETIVTKNAKLSTIVMFTTLTFVTAISIFGYMIKNDKVDIKKYVKKIYR